MKKVIIIKMPKNVYSAGRCKPGVNRAVNLLTIEDFLKMFTGLQQKCIIAYKLEVSCSRVINITRLQHFKIIS